MEVGVSVFTGTHFLYFVSLSTSLSLQSFHLTSPHWLSANESAFTCLGNAFNLWQDNLYLVFTCTDCSTPSQRWLRRWEMKRSVWSGKLSFASIFHELIWPQLHAINTLFESPWFRCRASTHLKSCSNFTSMSPSAFSHFLHFSFISLSIAVLHFFCNSLFFLSFAPLHHFSPSSGVLHLRQKLWDEWSLILRWSLKRHPTCLVWAFEWEGRW